MKTLPYVISHILLSFHVSFVICRSISHMCPTGDFYPECCAHLPFLQDYKLPVEAAPSVSRPLAHTPPTTHTLGSQSSPSTSFVLITVVIRLQFFSWLTVQSWCLDWKSVLGISGLEVKSPYQDYVSKTMIIVTVTEYLPGWYKHNLGLCFSFSLIWVTPPPRNSFRFLVH